MPHHHVDMPKPAPVALMAVGKPSSLNEKTVPLSFELMTAPRYP